MIIISETLNIEISFPHLYQHAIKWELWIFGTWTLMMRLWGLPVHEPFYSFFNGNDWKFSKHHPQSCYMRTKCSTFGIEHAATARSIFNQSKFEGPALFCYDKKLIFDCHINSRDPIMKLNQGVCCLTLIV